MRAVQEGAQREFARLGEPRTRAAGPLDATSQHDRRAMAGDLHQIFGGIRARRSKISGHNLVDRAAGVVQQFRERGGPGFPFVPAAKPQNLARNLARVAPGKAHNTQAGAAGRSGNRDDGVGGLDIGRLPRSSADRIYGLVRPPGLSSRGGPGRGGRIGSGTGMPIGKTTTCRNGPDPVLSLRISVSLRRLR